MRTGGLITLARYGLAHTIRGAGLRLSGPRASKACRWFADFIDPPRAVTPAREWDPRLWQRNHDPRSEQENRRS